MLHYCTKTFQEKGLILNFMNRNLVFIYLRMNRNLFSCVRFLTRSVLLVCTDAVKQESLFLPLTVNMLFVSMRKGWKGYFEGFEDLS